MPAENQRPYRIVDLNFVSLYVRDFEQAVAFYSQLFGPPEFTEEGVMLYGWRMGATWLTLFPATVGVDPERNPCNTEFAIQVAAVAEVDALYEALIAAGAQECRPPRDTQMYVPMRFACVDDPFGVRIDVYCLLAE